MMMRTTSIIDSSDGIPAVEIKGRATASRLADSFPAVGIEGRATASRLADSIPAVGFEGRATASRLADSSDGNKTFAPSGLNTNH